MNKLCTTSLLVVAMLAFSGCAPSGPKTATVAGSVTVDGAPLADGNMIFRDAAGKEKSYGGKVVAGEYSFESTPGSKKVEVRAMREVPGKMDESNPDEPVPAMEQYIPAKYNTETTLTAEVTDSGENRFDFTLTVGE